MKNPLFAAERRFYGTASLGEKGQVVIPVEARKLMKLHKGEKLLVFGVGSEMMAFSKLSGLEKFATTLQDQIAEIRNIDKKRIPNAKKKR